MQESCGLTYSCNNGVGSQAERAFHAKDLGHSGVEEPLKAFTEFFRKITLTTG